MFARKFSVKLNCCLVGFFVFSSIIHSFLHTHIWKCEIKFTKYSTKDASATTINGITFSLLHESFVSMQRTRVLLLNNYYCYQHNYTALHYIINTQNHHCFELVKCKCSLCLHYPTFISRVSLCLCFFHFILHLVLHCIASLSLKCKCKYASVQVETTIRTSILHFGLKNFLEDAIIIKLKRMKFTLSG